MEDNDEYEMHQFDMCVAGTYGKDALQEILYYATQYEQDGPVEIVKVTRTSVTVEQIRAMIDAKYGKKNDIKE